VLISISWIFFLEKIVMNLEKDKNNVFIMTGVFQSADLTWIKLFKRKFGPFRPKLIKKVTLISFLILEKVSKTFFFTAC